MQRSGRWTLVWIGAGVLVAVTALVFVLFDKDSHSASDTLRPFLITMVPVWIIAGVAARHLTGGKR